MRYRSLFPRDVFAELSRMQNQMQQAFDYSPSIRGFTRNFPALNVGGTEKAVDVYAFMPGVDPKGLDVQIEKGVLAIAGERKAQPLTDKATVHIDERFSGRFRRVVTLPDDVDANTVNANYKDGVLHIHIDRKETARPRKINVQ